MTMRVRAAVVCAVFSLPSLGLAHGGQYRGGNYRGPGDTVPDGNGGRTGSPGGPSTPGPGGPTAPTPGSPSTPGPTTGPTSPAPTGGGRSSGPTTGGPRGIDLGEDSTAWQLWWEFNKDPLLQLKKAIHKPLIRTGSDDFALGRGVRSETYDTLAPSALDIERTVLPALKQALLDPTSTRDIVSSCLIALAKVGRDVESLQLFRKFLADSDQEKRETAALAIGIAALPEGLPDLIALAKDDSTGRQLAGRRSGVDYRTRSFACYGLGLIAHAAKDHTIKTRAFDALTTVLDQTEARNDVVVAALNGIRLLRPDGSPTGESLRKRAIDGCASFLERRDVLAQVQAHALTALATLAGRSTLREPLLVRMVDTLADRKARTWLQQSAALALGAMATPEDAKVVETLQAYSLNGKDQQARFFALIALGQIGGEKARDFLRQRLLHNRTQAVQKPWIGLGLALMDHAQRQTPRPDAAAPEADGAANDVLQEFEATKAGLHASGLGLALGVMRSAEASERLLDRLIKHKNEDEAAGYLALALGLMGCQTAKEDIHQLLERASRRERLLSQCAVALGLLGDKEVSITLTQRLKEPNPVAVFSALAQGLGFVGDRRSLSGLVDLLGDKHLQPLNRAFAAVALGLVCDKEELPWNSKISVDINYRATVETLTSGSSGVLDIL